MAEQQAAAVQNQLNQLITQVQRLTAEMQDSRQREGTLVERLNQVAQQQVKPGTVGRCDYGVTETSCGRIARRREADLDR